MNTHREMSPVDLAWLVGLFEGEGCIGLCHQGRPTLQIGMTDEDVVRRAYEIAGIGKLRRKTQLTVGGKTMWVWCVGRCDEAARLIEVMLPHFCSRRAAKAREVLESYWLARPPKRLRTHCQYGHLMDEQNTRWDRSRGFNSRVCRKCSVRRTQESRDRARAVA